MIRIYEDNGNGLWLHLDGDAEAVCVDGAPDGVGLCDLRLYRDTWHPEDSPDDCLPASECNRMRHVATYDPNDDYVRWHAEPGSAARRYFSCPACDVLCGCECE